LLGHIQRGIGQGRAPELADRDIDRAMLSRTQRCRYLPRGGKFGLMALTVQTTQRVTLETAITRDRERGSGIESSRQQHHGSFHG
jgi:hypothetical protein